MFQGITGPAGPQGETGDQGQKVSFKLIICFGSFLINILCNCNNTH